MVLPRLAAQAVSGKPLTIFGDGRQVRTFLHVKDAARAIADLNETPAAYGQAFNLGGAEPVAINALARRIKKFSGSGSKVVHIPYKKYYGKNFDDVRCRIPDTTKLRKQIGFRPRYSLDDMVRESIATVIPGAL
jgi:UDP-glucose 4-epimerase